MNTLHILRNLDTALVFDAVETGPDGGDRLLLIQDGVLNQGPFPCDVSVAQDDLTARDIKNCPHSALTYEEIRDLMLAHTRVILW